MEPAKRMMVIFLDRLKHLKMVHTIVGIVIDSTDISLTVLGRNGKITIVAKETLLEVMEMVE